MAAELVNSEPNDNGSNIKLNILMMTMGTRGDMQPMLEIGKLLTFKHGHRVRVATHPRHQKYVEDGGLEFYSIGGGDPADFLAFRIQRIRDQIKGRHGMLANLRTMGEGYWKACIGSSDSGKDGSPPRAFVADAILSTPSCFPNISCASRLGIPLHIIGTNPWSPTRHFPHCLAAWCSVGDSELIYMLSYLLFYWRFFLPLKDILNELRLDWMGLEPFSFFWALSQITRMRIPHTYLWSSAFISKPPDWGGQIDIVGYTLDNNTSYNPPQALIEFLGDGETPIYVGFGSSKIPHSDEFIAKVFEAINKAGVRAVYCKGWSSLGSAYQNLPNIYVVDDVPHDWLFSRVSAVVYHGGAGTTSMALKHGRPAVVVSFYGDNAFWGGRLANAKVSVEPIFYKNLTAERLAGVIKEIMHPEFYVAAEQLARKIETDFNGVENAVESVLRTLEQYNGYRCAVLCDLPAIWKHKSSKLGLSTLAAHMLVEAGTIQQKDLELVYPVKWSDFTSPGDPITGLISSLTHTIGNISQDIRRIGAAFEMNTTWKFKTSVKKTSISPYRISPPEKTAQSLFFPVSKASLTLVLHILRAPLSLFIALSFGLYNLLDYFCYAFGSQLRPEGFANSPHYYTYLQMMQILFLQFPCELADIFVRPRQMALNSDSIFTIMMEVLCGIVRTPLRGLNAVVGCVALTVRALDLQFGRKMNERPNKDIIVEARIRQGKLEFEHLANQASSKGVELVKTVVQAWDTSVKAPRAP